MRRHLLRCTSPLFGTFRKRGGFRLESGMRAKAHQPTSSSSATNPLSCVALGPMSGACRVDRRYFRISIPRRKSDFANRQIKADRTHDDGK